MRNLQTMLFYRAGTSGTCLVLLMRVTTERDEPGGRAAKWTYWL